MGAFSDRFDHEDSGSSRRPECYGDPDCYDITDERCRQCPVKGTCRIKVQSLEREQRRSSTPTTTTYSPSTTPGSTYRPSMKSKVYEEPEAADTFTGVLAYNAGLNAITTMSETLTEALAGIPRKKYPSLKRRKVE